MIVASIQGIYVALFGRPADPAGLSYWNNVTKNGSDLSQMLKVLPGTAEYTSRFSGLSNSDAITNIYQSLFGRTPDASGLLYFQQKLIDGTLTLSNLAVNILDGATGSDLVRINAKISAANIFTSNLDTDAERASYVGDSAIKVAKDFIAAVTEAAPATTDSVNAVILKLGTPSAGGGVVDDAGPQGSPVFTSGSTATVAENSDITKVVYKAIVTDDNPEAPNYSLVGTDAASFTINADTGEVKFKSSPNFEVKSTYEIGVKATDSTGFASTKAVTVTITDVAETNTHTGSSSADTIDKSGSLDTWTINGLGGNDTIKGSAQGDTISGGAGADTLTGNGGNDTFKFAVGDSTQSAMDTITDWSSGDKIDLTAIDAKETWFSFATFSNRDTGQQQFTFGGQKVNPSFGEVSWYQQGGNTYIVADTTNSNDNDVSLTIKINGAVSLTAADFIL